MWDLSNAYVKLDNPRYDLSGGGPVLGKIQDYPTLAQALLDFSHRVDIASYQDYFINFGEARIYRDIFSKNMGNGVQWMETPFSATINATTGLVALPSGYIALKAMQITDGNSDTFTLLYKDPQWLYSNYPIRQPTGLPAYVARDGTNFVFGPFPDAAYALTGTYYQQSAPLSSTNTTTWMTAYASDLLFASCMRELQPFLKDVGWQQNWDAIYQDKLASLLDFDKAERFAPGAMTIEVE